MPESKSAPSPSPSQSQPDDDEVDETSVESFPASDAPSWAMGRRSEAPPGPAPPPRSGGVPPEEGGGRPRRMCRPDDEGRPVPSKR